MRWRKAAELPMKPQPLIYFDNDDGGPPPMGLHPVLDLMLILKQVCEVQLEHRRAILGLEQQRRRDFLTFAIVLGSLCLSSGVSAVLAFMTWMSGQP